MGPKEVTQYAGGQGTPFPFSKEMIKFSIIKTGGGKSSPGARLSFEPASVASLFAREWLQWCWQRGALAPDGLIKLVHETLLRRPLLDTPAPGCEPAPKLSGSVCALTRLQVGAIALPEAMGHTPPVADEEYICVSAPTLPQVTAPQPLGEVPQGESGCQREAVMGFPFPASPVVPGRCPQLAPGSPRIPWTCHPEGFTPWEKGKSWKAPRFTGLALITGILKSSVYYWSVIVRS